MSMFHANINYYIIIILSPYSINTVFSIHVYGFIQCLDGWCEGGVRQQRNDGGGCATMRKRPESVESPGTYVTE